MTKTDDYFFWNSINLFNHLDPNNLTSLIISSDSGLSLNPKFPQPYFSNSLSFSIKHDSTGHKIKISLDIKYLYQLIVQLDKMIKSNVEITVKKLSKLKNTVLEFKPQDQTVLIQIYEEPKVLKLTIELNKNYILLIYKLLNNYFDNYSTISINSYNTIKNEVRDKKYEETLLTLINTNNSILKSLLNINSKISHKPSKVSVSSVSPPAGFVPFESMNTNGDENEVPWDVDITDTPPVINLDEVTQISGNVEIDLENVDQYNDDGVAPVKKSKRAKNVQTHIHATPVMGNLLNNDFFSLNKWITGMSLTDEKSSPLLFSPMEFVMVKSNIPNEEMQKVLNVDNFYNLQYNIICELKNYYLDKINNTNTCSNVVYSLNNNILVTQKEFPTLWKLIIEFIIIYSGIKLYSVELSKLKNLQPSKNKDNIEAIGNFIKLILAGFLSLVNKNHIDKLKEDCVKTYFSEINNGDESQNIFKELKNDFSEMTITGKLNLSEQIFMHILNHIFKLIDKFEDVENLNYNITNIDECVASVLNKKNDTIISIEDENEDISDEESDEDESENISNNDYKNNMSDIFDISDKLDDSSKMIEQLFGTIGM